MTPLRLLGLVLAAGVGGALAAAAALLPTVQAALAPWSIGPWPAAGLMPIAAGVLGASLCAALAAWLATRQERRSLLRRASWVDLSQHPVLVLDAQARVEWANAALMQRTGRSGSQVLGRELGLVLGLPGGEPREQLDQALAHQQALVLDAQGADLHGQALAWQIELQPLRDATGRWQGATVMAFDATATQTQWAALRDDAARARNEGAALLSVLEVEREQSEQNAKRREAERAAHDAALALERAAHAQALAAQEGQSHRLARSLGERDDRLARQRAALQGVGAGCWSVELAQGRVTLDEAAEQLLGPLPSWLAPGHPAQWLEAVHPADTDAARAALLPLLAGTRAQADCSLRLRSEGPEAPGYRLRAAVLAHDAQGRPLRLGGTLQRLSAAQRAEIGLAELWRTGERLHGAASLRLDVRTQRLHLSPQGFDLLGLAQEAGVLEWSQWLALIDDAELAQHCRSVVDAALAAQPPQSWCLSLPLRSALGARQWVLWRAEPREAADGQWHWWGVLQAAAEPARIDVAAPDPQGAADDAGMASTLTEQLRQWSGREAALARFGGAPERLAQAAALLAPSFLQLAGALRGLGDDVDARRRRLRQASLLARSLGAEPLAEALAAHEAAQDLPEPLSEAIETVVQGWLQAA